VQDSTTQMPSRTAGSAGSGAVEIVPVTTAADRDAFIRVPFAIYGPDDKWIPPLIVERREHFSPRKNPYFEHAEAALWIARRAGRDVGRISAQVCALHRQRHGADRGQFGFIEAIDDAEVFAALFGAAEAWLRARGTSVVDGPFNFSINDEMGLLVDGLDTPPSLMMGHAKPYYPARVEALGYAKVKDVLAYDYHTSAEQPRAAAVVAAKVRRAKDAGELDIRPIRKARLDEDLETILDIFNDAWHDNWGFVPWTTNEIGALGTVMKMLVKEEYVAIAHWHGEPAAFAVTLPNINDWIADLNGKLLPFGWAKLLWRLMARPPRSVRLPLMGVRKVHQGTAVGAALSMGVIDTLRVYHMSRGTDHAELSWILEDNMPMRRMIEILGGRVYKTYRIYRKALDE
jgi:hypothetical protein